MSAPLTDGERYIGFTLFSRPAMARLLSAVLIFACAAASCLGRIGVEYQMQLGNPSSATADAANHTRYLIQRAQYAMDYNDTLRLPNWVSWDLTSGDVGGSGRSSFSVDTTLPAGFTRISTSAYSGSGFDRGHMCPSGDRTITEADNEVTFYMSNMIPQTADNNQGVWANFESYCRTLASAGNEVLITCGPADFSGAKISSGVAIPGSVWKIVLVVPSGSGTALSRVNRSTRTIAIKIPNIDGVRSDPWQNYLTSPAQIELATGYTFFSALSSSTSNYLRLVVDGQPAPSAPSINTPPASQTVSTGTNVTFTVGAGGSAPLAYQWRKDGVPVATTASLTLSAISPGSSGAYDVIVTNSLGSATSSAANLRVTQTFTVWATAYGLTTINAAPTADPDRDGQPNLMEYALGLNPSVADVGQPVQWTPEGNQLVFRFTRPKSAVGVSYEAQTSPDLASWASAGALILESSTATTETLAVSVMAVTPSQFVRLKVTAQ